jgi:hypothetical protein
MKAVYKIIPHGLKYLTMNKLERKAKQKELKLNNKQLKELHDMIQNCGNSDLVVKGIAKEYITVHTRDRKTRKMFKRKFGFYDLPIFHLVNKIKEYMSFNIFLKMLKFDTYGRKRKKRRLSKLFSRYAKYKHF